VARNRKRAKERRSRRPQPVPARARESRVGAPSPLEHATPDVELAELAELPPAFAEPGTRPGDERSEGLERSDDPEAALEDEDELERAVAGGGRNGISDGGSDRDGGDGGPGSGGGEIALGGAAVPQPRAVPANRLITFLQGSWRELQRVQWPDRRQVFQATGVVIGFVIVAGVLLGVSDLISQKVVNLILYGHG
jgi:preprotein translocase subunit SecE